MLFILNPNEPTRRLFIFRVIATIWCSQSKSSTWNNLNPLSKQEKFRP